MVELMFLLLFLSACSDSPQPVALKDAAVVDTKRLEIIDGKIDFQRLAGDSKRCAGVMPTTNRGASPCVESDTYVAPIIDGNSPASPVLAWATCSGRESSDIKICRAQLQGAPRVQGSVVWRVGSSTKTVWGKAVNASGEVSVPGAPVLRIDLE